MPENFTSKLHPAGLDLFTDAETFLVDLSEDDESMITGGARSASNSGTSLVVRRRRQLVLRRRRLLAARRRRQLALRRRRQLAARRPGNSVSRT